MRAALVSLVLFTSSCAGVPTGEAGASADALARKIEQNVRRDKWDEVGAVTFAFRDTRTHLWDRARGMHHVKSGDLEVWLDLWDRGGVVKKAGVVVTGDAAQKALADAWSWFCNDTFWLNPLVKLFDDGVTREIVTVDGRPALKVAYASGGVTPGDTYVYLVDDAGTVTAVRMWVQVLPIKGLEFTFGGWQELDTGARIATSHVTAGNDVSIGALRGARTLADLVPGPDPFAALVARRAGGG